MSLADTVWGAYTAQNKANQERGLAELQQAHGAMGILAALQQQQQAAQMRDALSSSGGDVEKALQAAISSGNLAGAHQLAPLVKMAHEKRTAEETRAAMRDINGMPPPNAVAPPAGTPSPDGQQPDATQPPAPADPRKDRLDKLAKLSVLYANNPVVSQRIQAEIDRLSNVKPLIEHNFSVGDNMVQPHMSEDNGKTWNPIPGSQPSAKFARQVVNVSTGDGDNKPLTDMAKLNADLKAGRITQEQFDAMSTKKMGDPNAVLTSDAINDAASRYKIDGTLPPNLGRGTQGYVNTAKILNKAAELAKEEGNSGEAARITQIANRANVQALGQLEKQRNLVEAFKKNAMRNAEIVLETSSQVDRLGSPAVDRWIQAGKKNIAGDVEVAKLDTAVRTFVNEYARITTSITGGGVTSDHARREIDQLLNSAQTKDQVIGVIEIMKREMNNRSIGYAEQSAEIKGRLSNTTRPEIPKVPGAPPATVIKFDANGNQVK